MGRGVSLFVVVFACAVTAATLAATAQAGPLRTAISDPSQFASPKMDRAYARTRAAGAQFVRLVVYWRNVELHRPRSRIDPNDAAYNWAGADREIIGARSRGLEPIVVIMSAPNWVSGRGRGTPGSIRPNAIAFGAFARAAAKRYSGTFVPRNGPYAEPLPRVRYWQAWNEPNRDYFLRPQLAGQTVTSATIYRTLVNHFADGVRAVHRSNVVVAGGLAPLARRGKPSPTRFMRAFLAAPAKFDVWAHHPYTSGGPTHRAMARGDISLGNLPEMRRELNGFIRAGRIRSSRPVQFWVTEFSWDARPADPRGVPAAIHQRWTAEALYRMWQNGVSLVTWFKISDDPLRGRGSTPFQSGFYTAAGKPKGSLRAFRFPVVAFRSSGGIFVWGRTPTSSGGTVIVELKRGSSWTRLGAARASGYGIFTKTFRTYAAKGHVRARFDGESSLGFSLTPVANRSVNPFGCGGAIRC